VLDDQAPLCGGDGEREWQEDEVRGKTCAFFWQVSGCGDGEFIDRQENRQQIKLTNRTN
jgi:hypothetical protein